MKNTRLLLLLLCAVLLISICIPGVYAAWEYYKSLDPMNRDIPLYMGHWTYPMYTITYVNNGVVLAEVTVWDIGRNDG